MFTREDALKAIREKFPEDKTFNYTAAGVEHTFVATPEHRLRKMIDLHEPTFDGLKEGASGLDIGLSEFFLKSVEHNYKNENGLW